MRVSLFFPVILVIALMASAAGEAQAKKMIASQEGPSSKQEMEALTQAVTAWLDAHPEGLVLDFKEETPGVGLSVYPHYNNPSSYAPDQPDSLFIYSDSYDRRYLSISFNKPISSKTDLKTVQDSFSHIALGHLPMPGLELPDWNFSPQTPKSSFEEGVEITAFDGKHIELKVTTTFFAVYGTKPACPEVMDAPTPEGCYFQVRRDFPLTLTLNVPVFTAAQPRPTE
jgi:hypothetical protein